MPWGQPDVVDNQSQFTVWGRTLTVGDHVYLLRNICHFGAGSIPRTPIPWLAVGGGACVGFFIVLIGVVSRGFFYLGLLVMLGMLCCFFYNLANRNRPGLLVSLSSGEKVFFPTADKDGVDRVADWIRGMFNEVTQEIPPQTVNISQNSVQILEGASVIGNINSGYVGNGMHVDRGAKTDMDESGGEVK